MNKKFKTGGVFPFSIVVHELLEEACVVSSTLVLQLCQHGEGASRSAHDRVNSLHYKKSKAVTVHIFGHTSIMEICITNMVYPNTKY